jgi:hypothetical protein
MADKRPRVVVPAVGEGLAFRDIDAAVAEYNEVQNRFMETLYDKDVSESPVEPVVPPEFIKYAAEHKLIPIEDLLKRRKSKKVMDHS